MSPAWMPTPKLEPESGTTPCKTRDAQGKWSIGEPSGTRPLDPLIKSEPREERKERDEYERSATYEDEDDDDHERRLKAR